MSRRAALCILIAAALLSASSIAAHYAKYVHNAAPDPCAGLLAFGTGKPEILVLGDSIAMGYRPFVARGLPAFEVVSLPAADGAAPCNAESTEHTLKFINHWLAQRSSFAVILWNNGIWDISKTKHAKLSTTPDRYRENLFKLGIAIRAKTSHPVFLLTTNIPSNTYGRQNADVLVFNQIAIDVMSRLGIPVIDLYSVSRANTARHVHDTSNGDVHFDDTGYAILGDAVLKGLRAAYRIPN